ncbi:carbonic anhydrase [Mollisia scopiformis]|uniref:Carbonic anhydrase n=1 Tax=Mollisia scopiformis TaxID=149040 RepID=A0A194X9B4_MOLSC|nr:carbonic anhydrase [Mollisia scopiformis]KUJ16760.1 carbonic anhydrase [Mollisia scopiformis]
MSNPTPAQRLESILSRNEEYAETYKAPGKLMDGIEKRKKSGAKSMVIIACADPRVHPMEYLDLNRGEAAILRNAGGRTQGVIRSLLVLDALGDVGTVVVVHHTDCGTSQFGEKGEDEFQHRIEEKHPGLAEDHHGCWGAINDPYKTIVEDVDFLKSFPTIAENMEVFGLVLDTFTGKLKQIV